MFVFPGDITSLRTSLPELIDQYRFTQMHLAVSGPCAPEQGDGVTTDRALGALLDTKEGLGCTFNRP